MNNIKPVALFSKCCEDSVLWSLIEIHECEDSINTAGFLHKARKPWDLGHAWFFLGAPRIGVIG